MRITKYFLVCIATLSFQCNAWSQQTAVQLEITLEQQAGHIDVKVGDDLFTRYDYSTYDKPILYPVMGHSQVEMTRNYPMKQVPGEASDHPHHKSIWFAHGDVNGIDFWSEKGGVVRHQEIMQFDPEHQRFKTKDHWIERREDGKGLGDKIAECECTYKFGSDENARWIVCEYKVIASEMDLKFGDTKEGTFAVRSHPQLRIKSDPKRGVESVTGHAINSEGDDEATIWGKPAKWVSYWGQVGDHKVGLAIMDHPSNLRHPTTWHARDYGLIAANPFGLHYFKEQEEGAGDFTLAKGETWTQKWCVVVYTGNHESASIESRFDKFAKY